MKTEKFLLLDKTAKIYFTLFGNCAKSLSSGFHTLQVLRSLVNQTLPFRLLAIETTLQGTLTDYAISVNAT